MEKANLNQLFVVGWSILAILVVACFDFGLCQIDELRIDNDVVAWNGTITRNYDGGRWGLKVDERFFDSDLSTGRKLFDDAAWINMSLDNAWEIDEIEFTINEEQEFDILASFMNYFNLNDNTWSTININDTATTSTSIGSYGYWRWNQDTRGNTSVVNSILTNQLFIQVKCLAIAQETRLVDINIEGKIPTQAPTVLPTMYPTTPAPTAPTLSPSTIPSLIPTNEPTTGPTPAPTYALYLKQTERNESLPDSNFTQSTNVYALSERNKTYTTFTVPGGGAFCTTCILAWADIDARITVPGCAGSMDFGTVDPITGEITAPGTFYNCNATWILETSASLVDWQQTYGRIEIWEVDDYGRKYQQLFYEFQWDSEYCYWYDESTGEEVECDVLPLTGSTKWAARFEWTMPKTVTDNRDSPLIIVWYDLLSIPYSLRPALNDSYTNLTFKEVEEGADLGLNEVVKTFQVALYAMGALMAGFIIVMIIACVAADEAILKADYMLDTRDIRTTYIHSVTTLIAPQSELHKRSKFSMKRHGLWLFLVLAFRIVYMLIFTFWFFVLVFQSLNNASFKVLDTYDSFAHERDAQLTNISQNIESYYYNETDRMEQEVETKQYYCYSVYINETARLYEEGALAQYNNHSTQMSNSLNGINFNVTTGMYIEGNTACNIDGSTGAFVGSKDPYKTFVYNEGDGSLNSTIYYRAEAYDRFSDNVNDTDAFEDLEELLTALCETYTWCVGWTWIDAYCENTTDSTTTGTTGSSNVTLSNNTDDGCYNNSYYFLETMGDPVNNPTLSGICYATSDFDASLFNFDTIEELANYTDYLENLYLTNYVADVDSLYDTFTNIWTAFKSLSGEDGQNTFEVSVDNTATEFDVTVYYGKVSVDLLANGYNFTSNWNVIISCPGCPDGNFSNAYLQQISDYLFSYNYSNISDFVNTVGGNNVNFSDVVSVNTALLEFPDIPEIDLPFDIDLPSLGFWDLIASLYISLDVMLFIYRWYRTAGILATIVRGKDVEIQLKYLQTEVAPPRPCWEGREFADKLLNSIIWCHDKFRHCGYNLWKFMYWISTLLCLSIVLILILMMYVIVDAVVTEEFFESIGAFDLLTVGIAAQRSIRNEVISTTAAAYNNYTLDLLQESRITYASEKNSDAWDQNVDELDRVDEYNSYFCTAYTAYQATDRDVLRDTTEGYIINDYYLSGNSDDKDNAYISSDDINNIFDQDTSTSFKISSNTSITSDNTLLSIEIELPPIIMTTSPFLECYWQLSQFEFTWNYYDTGINAGVIDEITFTVESRTTSNINDSFVEQDLNTNKYSVSSSQTTTLLDVESLTFDWDDEVTRYLRFNFSSILNWESTYELADITIYGAADENCIKCQTVTFYYWDFDASDTYIELCPEVTPIHGIMYRGFVRDWLTDQLIDGHGPFIRAIRNICLSPFAIMLVGAVAIIIVYLVAFVVEWILLRVNLYRENPYAKVSLVHAKNSEFYDPSMHDVDAKSGTDPHGDKTTYFGNSGTLLGDQAADGGGGAAATGSQSNIQPADEIEATMHVELGNMHNTLRNKARTTEKIRENDKNNAASYLASIGVTAAQDESNQANIIRQGSDTGTMSAGAQPPRPPPRPNSGPQW